MRICSRCGAPRWATGRPARVLGTSRLIVAVSNRPSTCEGASRVSQHAKATCQIARSLTLVMAGGVGDCWHCVFVAASPRRAQPRYRGAQKPAAARDFMLCVQAAVPGWVERLACRGRQQPPRQSPATSGSPASVSATSERPAATGWSWAGRPVHGCSRNRTPATGSVRTTAPPGQRRLESTHGRPRHLGSTALKQSQAADFPIWRAKCCGSQEPIIASPP